jgi:adenine-specific DNA-methyltransferase
MGDRRLMPPSTPPEPPEPPATPGRFADAGAGKLRGGYYTSPEVAAWLCAWAVRAASDSILEPSCGDGAFLAAAAERLGELGAGAAAIARQLAGIEVVPAEAAVARERLRGRLGFRAAAAVAAGDFFEWWLRPGRPRFDAAVGNPPFIRYQTFPEPHRGRAMAILSRLGLKPNRLTNVWVPFVAAAAAALVPGGRLALVLPAELLQVTYAGQLRSFLAGRFARIDIVACNELLFATAEQEVVLLLADGARDARDGAVAGGAARDSRDACRVALTAARTAAEVTARPPAAVLAAAVPQTIRHDEEKWLQYFLSAREIDLMRELRGASAVTALRTHAGVDVGVVTGSNEFFVLSRRRVEELGLAAVACMLPLVSRSAQLKGARITAAEWQVLAAAGERVQLLCLGPPNGGPKGASKGAPKEAPKEVPKEAPNGAPLAPALASYIRQGEAGGVHRGYKCSIRSPWYAVPAVWIPEGFLFRQIHDFPRVVRNEAAATSTDTIHRLTCRADPELVMANLYTHLTAASAEIEGRSYGGGVLELEPTEAERLLVPARLAPALPLAECDRLVRAGKLGQALDENDRLVLAGQLGLSRADCTTLREIWVKMRDRRIARRRVRRAPAP